MMFKGNAQPGGARVIASTAWTCIKLYLKIQFDDAGNAFSVLLTVQANITKYKCSYHHKA